MLVVEAREIGRGRALAVDPDVLDRGLDDTGAIMDTVADYDSTLWISPAIEIIAWSTNTGWDN